MKHFFINRVKALKYACKGALLLVCTEDSIKIQLGIFMVLVVAGFYFNISTTEWLLQLLAAGMVLGMESINTSIEKLADFIHPQFHKKIGFIKDIAAGAVFFVSVMALICGGIIYIPKIIGT